MHFISIVNHFLGVCYGPFSRSSTSHLDKSRLQDDALMDTPSPSSGEPSVNQPTPEFLPVQQEVEQQALLTEIREVLQQEYRRYIIRSSPWMKYNIAFLFGHDIQLQVESIVTNLELESSSTAELNEFLQDIRGNPNQLHSFFKEYWYGPKWFKRW